MPIQTIFFDLDDTLYPRGSGVWEAMLERIESYMHERVGIPLGQVPAVRTGYLERFGTSLRGLKHEYDIDADEYLDYVHQIPIENLIAPNPQLEQMLARLPQRKLVFTNSSRAHAGRVLRALGVESYFEEVIDVKAMQFRSKPDPAAYQLALERGGIQAAAALFVDDMPVNLQAARRLGAATALVGSAAPHPAADVSVPLAELLLDAWPALVESAHA